MGVKARKNRSNGSREGRTAASSAGASSSVPRVTTSSIGDGLPADRLFAWTDWIYAIALVAAIFVVYRLSWHGGFVFDDFGTLPALGATGPVDGAARFWRYVTAGSSDPTGRPLSMLSFLIDANDWPTDPYPFNALDSKPQTSHPFELGRFAFEDMDK